jgi:acrylyl-CoA reductase (NADPH)
MSGKSFKALVVRKEGKELTHAIEEHPFEALPEGELLVRVACSSMNFKDAMALGNRGILRNFPAVPGIDLAGAVVEAGASAFKPGDPVLVTGWGVGEARWGGFAEYARVKPEWALPLPEGLTPRTAMAFGTAGLTAMLGVLALERNGVTPGGGEVLVTGATGGVGSIGLALLAALGYEVVAMSGKPELHDLLTRLGAKRIVDRSAFATPSKPGRFVLEPETFQGALDSVGGETLASILARIKYGGSVAACGLVGGANVDTTVFPFILRGVNLLGIDSVKCPTATRQVAWNRLAQHIDLVAPVVRELSLAEVPAEAGRMLEGGAKGRVVVSLG